MVGLFYLAPVALLWVVWIILWAIFGLTIFLSVLCVLLSALTGSALVLAALASTGPKW